MAKSVFGSLDVAHDGGPGRAWPGPGGGGKLIVLCLLGALLTVQEGVKAGMICEMRFYLFLPLQQLPTLYFV